MVLEFSQYLENYLWPNFRAESSQAHMMSIVVMLNEKFRERVQAWQAITNRPEYFGEFFKRVLLACLPETELSLKEKTALLVFLNHCFNSMEITLCRDQVKRLVSLSMWISLQPARREQEFKSYPKWRKYWRAIQKKDKPDQLEQLMWERKFLHRLMLSFIKVLETIPAEGVVHDDTVSILTLLLSINFPFI